MVGNYTAKPKRLFTVNYILILLTNFLIYFVDYAMMLWTTAWAIRHFKADVSVAGLASGLFIVGALIARVPIGRFIDFIGRRRTFIIGALVYLASSPLYLLCPNVWILCVLRLIHGFGFGTASSASSTAIAAMILVMSLLIKCPERSILQSELKQLMRFKIGDFFERNALQISTIAMLGGICYSSVLSYIAAYADYRGVSGIGATGFFIFFAAMTVLSRPFAGWLIDHCGGNVTIIPAILCEACSMLVMAFAKTDAMFLIGAVLLGYGYGTITAGCHTLAVHVSPLHRIGVGTSTYFVFLDVGVGVGPYFLGLFVKSFGFESIYLISFVIAIAAALFFYTYMFRARLFTRERMDRTAKAKMLRQKRRNRDANGLVSSNS